MSMWSSGIDLGTTHLRAVVLKSQGKRWAWHRAVSIPRVDERGHRRDLPELFRLLRKNIRLRGPVRLLDSTVNVLVRFVSHPPVSDDRLQRGMRMELIQHADAEGNLAADFMALPIEGENLTVCCCLAQPGDVDRLMETNDRYGMGIRQLGPAMAGVADCFAELVAPQIDGDFIEQPPPPAIDFGAEDDSSAEMEAYDEEEAPVGPEPDRYSLLLDIGAAGSRVVLMRNRDFLACRSLPVGGRRFSEDLAEARDIDLEQAERLKVSGEASPRVGEQIGALAARAAAESDDGDALFDDEGDDDPPADIHPGDDPATDRLVQRVVADDDDSSTDMEEVVLESDEVPELPVRDEAAETAVDEQTAGGDPVPPTLRAMQPVGLQPGGETVTLGNRQLGPELRRVAENLFMQISSSVNWFRAQLQQPRLTIDHVYCSGGGARLAGLPAYLERRFRCPVRLIEGELLDGLQGSAPEHAALYVNAIGAAVPYGRQAMRFDLRSQDRQHRDLTRSLVMRPYVAAALVLIAVLVTGFSLHQRHQRTRTTLALYAEHEERYEDLEKELRDLQQKSVDLQEDLRGIAGRIFSGRDLLNAIRVFKERAPEDLWITDLRTEGLTSSGEEAGDSSIDRGSIYIAGQCKPRGQRTDRVKIFEKWCESIAAWRPESDGLPLFTSHKMDFDTGTLESDAASRAALVRANQAQPFTFWARFDFMPTQLAEVATLVEEADSEPPVDDEEGG